MKLCNNKKKSIIIIVSMVVVMMAVSIISMCLSKKIAIFEKGVKYLANQNSITVVLLSLGIFQLFKNLDIKYNIIIGKLAQVSFSVYLIQENPHFRSILWNNIVKTQEYFYKPTYMLVLNMILATIGIYGVAMIIDLTRKKVVEGLYMSFYEKRIESKLKKFERILNN